MESIIALGGLTTLYIASSSKNKVNKHEQIYTKRREPEGFSKSIQDSINLVTFSRKTNPVGSYKYKIHAYPSDVDIFEIVRECCTLPKLQTLVVKEFKNIAKNILKKNDTILGDFKAGIDYNMFFNFGEIVYEKKLKVINYSKSAIIENIKRFNNNKWITLKEYNEIKKLIIDKPTIAEFNSIYEKIRNLYLVRWNLNELISGSKILRSGYNLTLEEAITHDSIVKIDIIAPINMRYTEVTNIYYLILEDSKGNETIINKKLGKYLDELDKDINKYSSILFRNSLKIAKRLWIKNNLLKNKKILELLYSLFFNGSSALNQIKEEAKTIYEIIEKYRNDDTVVKKKFKTIKPILINQLDEFKKRINNIYDIKFDTVEIYKTLDKVNQSKSIDILLKNITKFINIITPIIESNASKYLIDNKLIKMVRRKPGIENIEDIVII